MGAHWIEVNGGDVYPGRSFTGMEDAALSRVAVVSPKFADQLFGSLDPIGRTVKIAGVPFEIIGIYNQPPSLFGGSSPPIAVVPHSTFAKYVPHWRGWLQIAVSPAENATQQDAMDQVTALLRSMRNVKPGAPDNFALVTQDKILDTWNKVTGAFFAVMLGLSSIGLMVGGVGVVAIMMISVTERTREIGVRKALGATRREIMWQFLVEAATVTMVGGAFGMLIGGLVAFIVSHVTPIPAYVPLWSIVAALAGSALTGVGFGLYPAAKAAKLDPIEALRYE
jgi:putative ABC transport system permease protein